MRSIAELQRGVSTLATDEATKIDTTGITDMRPTKWSSEVIKFGESLRLLDQLVYVNKEMVGSKNTTITVPVTTEHMSITNSKTEGTTARTLTEMESMDTVDFTIVTTDFLQGAIAISKRLFMTCAIDLLAQARYSIAQDLADDVDLALATALQSTSIDTTNGVVFGGDATSVTEIAAGDVITTDLIADAIRIVENSKLVGKYLVISPYQKATLLKDSQFVNASEYGSDKVVLKGEIGEYIGLKVIVATNDNFAPTTGGTETNEAATPGADMNICPVIGERKDGQKVSVGLAWKEMPNIGYEYEKDASMHKIYYDQAFTTNIIFTEAVALIKVSQI